jgi:hypothetical protein
MPRLDGLWQENADAWQTYQLLCGRTVRDCRLEGWLVTRWTDGWSTERVISLMDRLNLIFSVLEPHGRPQN